MDTDRKAVGYCRAGSVDQAQIDRQKKALKELAKKHNLRIARFYIDNGYSGATLERPEFERLMADCRAGKVGTIFITDVDRVARHTSLVAEALWMCGRYKVRVNVVNGDGLKFFWTIFRAIAEPKV